MIDSKYMYLSPPSRAIAMSSKNVAVQREGISLLGRILLPGFDDESQKDQLGESGVCSVKSEAHVLAG